MSLENVILYNILYLDNALNLYPYQVYIIEGNLFSTEQPSYLSL
jgi:hypothetical protein